MVVKVFNMWLLVGDNTNEMSTLRQQQGCDELGSSSRPFRDESCLPCLTKSTHVPQYMHPGRGDMRVYFLAFHNICHTAHENRLYLS